MRALCLGAGLGEELRWGIPAYRHAGRTLALIGAFRDNVMLTFPDAGLLTDPEGLLQPAGPNSRAATTIRFTSQAEIEAKAPAIRALLLAARQAAAEGRVPERHEAAFDLPGELAEALDADPELAGAFSALTPGRQRSHALFIASAKAAATRLARVQRQRPLILAGKGANER